MTGIYKIVSPSNKIYIGATNCFKRRMNEYKSNSCKEQKRLYFSLNKYGFNNHNYKLVEECNINELNDRERYWQEYYNVIGKMGLNCQYVNTKKKRRIISDETKIKMSLATSGKNNPNYGKKLSNETKLKISNSHKGRTHSIEQNNKHSKFMKGKIYSKLSKKIINTDTNIIYNSINKASKALNINYSTLKKYLSGVLNNKTTLKYL